MEETIAELRRQIEEQQRLREAAERREEEERKAREDAERRVQPNSLFRLLDRCHNSLSRAIRVEADATLTTQGDAADPVNRLYPKHIVPWRDFPQLQEEVWGKFDRTAAFTSHPLFPFDTQIDYVVTNIQNRPIYSEASLRNLERDTVDNCIEKVINALRDDEPLRYDFGIQGRVTFYDRAKSSETSLDISLEQMDLEDARTPQRPANTRHRQKMIPPLSSIFCLSRIKMCKWMCRRTMNCASTGLSACYHASSAGRRTSDSKLARCGTRPANNLEGRISRRVERNSRNFS